MPILLEKSDILKKFQAEMDASKAGSVEYLHQFLLSQSPDACRIVCESIKNEAFWTDQRLSMAMHDVPYETMEVITPIFKEKRDNAKRIGEFLQYLVPEVIKLLKNEIAEHVQSARDYIDIMLSASCSGKNKVNELNEALEENWDKIISDVSTLEYASDIHKVIRFLPEEKQQAIYEQNQAKIVALANVSTENLKFLLDALPLDQARDLAENYNPKVAFDPLDVVPYLSADKRASLASILESKNCELEKSYSTAQPKY